MKAFHEDDIVDLCLYRVLKNGTLQCSSQVPYGGGGTFLESSNMEGISPGAHPPLAHPPAPHSFEPLPHGGPTWVYGDLPFAHKNSLKSTLIETHKVFLTLSESLTLFLFLFVVVPLQTLISVTTNKSFLLPLS